MASKPPTEELDEQSDQNENAVVLPLMVLRSAHSIYRSSGSLCVLYHLTTGVDFKMKTIKMQNGSRVKVHYYFSPYFKDPDPATPQEYSCYPHRNNNNNKQSMSPTFFL
eukprot:GEZU01010047.1.p1 GENE.GEZU01010047.1~~GEZU01010047.1.p1  ORF type:complete len:109 (+),score=8.77 GEZU01010047.1:327-653(+)